ncbi:zinc transporter 2-like isoform X3 [Syngnathus acus]|uniref:zinc transporter 2-like isoform X3 n=1 Tax=Syngnathus acus TaxID=161584 RepID=UPI0018860FAC|nr:zinc transporter 2-like isoform X3 [Syngnathus acus]
MLIFFRHSRVYLLAQAVKRVVFFGQNKLRCHRCSRLVALSPPPLPSLSQPDSATGNRLPFSHFHGRRVVQATAAGAYFLVCLFFKILELNIVVITLSRLSSDSESSEDLEWSCCDGDELDSAERAERRRAGKRLMVALVISLVFMVAEVLGGYASHSLAIMTDAAHLLSDVGSISLSIFSLWISGRTPTRTFTFGWRRAEIVGMLVSLSSIWAVTAVLVWSAARRISDGDYDIDTDIMLLTSGCGVATLLPNLTLSPVFSMVLILQQSGVSHTHNHALPNGWPQKDEARRDRGHRHGNASVKAACVHAVGDLIQSVGVLLAAAVIHFWSVRWPTLSAHCSSPLWSCGLHFPPPGMFSEC